MPRLRPFRRFQSRQIRLQQNNAAQNRLAVNQAQTKLATDTARQVEDLRAQGEFFWLDLAAPTAAAAPAADDDFGDTPAATPAWPASRELRTTIAWMDDEPLVAGRVYWALHGHRWVKARVLAVVHKLNINTLAEEAATQLDPNAIGHVELLLQEAIPAAPFTQARVLGSLILVDTASHKTAGAVLVN